MLSHGGTIPVTGRSFSALCPYPCYPCCAVLCAAVLCRATPEPILLDGLLQAVTLKTGDVVAVRTAARPMPTYFGCYEHQMQLNPKAIHRPVLSSLVQVGGLCEPLHCCKTWLHELHKACALPVLHPSCLPIAACLLRLHCYLPADFLQVP